MHYRDGFGLGRAGGPPGLVPLASSIPSPSEAVQTFGQTAGQNSGLAVLLILLVGLPAIVFNSALKVPHSKIVASPGRIRRAVRAVERRLARLHGAMLLIGFAVIGSVLYALDDPTFGLNVSSAAEIFGYVGAIVVTTAVTEVGRGVYVHRRFNKVGELRAFPLGIVIAVVFVAFSRISHFEPGYVFGIMMAIVFRVELTADEDGRSTTYAALWQIVLATAAWFAWIPVKDSVIAGNSSFPILAIDSLLAYVWICGLQSLFFGLIPARYMDGETIFRWSKVAWASLYIVIAFVFVQFIVHPSAAGYGGNKQASLLPMLSIFLVSAIAATVFWVYAHRKYGKPSVASISTVTTSLPAPGWFPDPTGRFGLRYWGGTGWTEHVASGTAQGTDYL